MKEVNMNEVISHFPKTGNVYSHNIFYKQENEQNFVPYLIHKNRISPIHYVVTLSKCPLEIKDYLIRNQRATIEYYKHLSAVFKD